MCSHRLPYFKDGDVTGAERTALAWLAQGLSPSCASADDHAKCKSLFPRILARNRANVVAQLLRVAGYSELLKPRDGVMLCGFSHFSRSGQGKDMVECSVSPRKRHRHGATLCPVQPASSGVCRTEFM